MRIFVTALMLAVVLASSAFAGNVALSGLGATAVCGPTTGVGCTLSTFVAGNTIDGNYATLGDKWVAPSGAANPWVLVTLNQVYTVDTITITGNGNTGVDIGFTVYAGTTAGLTGSNLVDPQVQGTTVEVGNASGLWTDVITLSSPTPIQYVLYDVTESQSSTYPSYDNAYANDIEVDAVPEPGTIGLIGSGLLALGFTLRRKK